MLRLLLSSPVGPIYVEYDENAVREVRFWPPGEHPPAGTRDIPAPADFLGREIVRELRQYFAGERREFSLPLAAQGTAFQWRVWEALARVPYGETRSYGEIARAIGKPGAARAVGQANRRNRLPIILPCHRVISANGSLGGYMGALAREDSVAIKRWLLGHEREIRTRDHR
jgi:methylated-DNA-[protein]-cysteine S-methyltransferase